MFFDFFYTFWRGSFSFCVIISMACNLPNKKDGILSNPKCVFFVNVTGCYLSWMHTNYKIIRIGTRKKSRFFRAVVNSAEAAPIGTKHNGVII